MATVRPEYCRSCCQAVASSSETVCEGWRWTLWTSTLTARQKESSHGNNKTALFRATPNLEGTEVLIREINKPFHFIFVSITAQCIAYKAGVIDFNFYDKIHRSLPFAAWKCCFCGPLIKSRYFSNQSIKLLEIWWAYFQYDLVNTCKIWLN